MASLAALSAASDAIDGFVPIGVSHTTFHAQSLSAPPPLTDERVGRAR